MSDLVSLPCEGVSSGRQDVILGMCPKEGSNPVDSASIHTLVSKIKPCMSNYKYYTVKLQMAHYISYNLFDSPLLLG